MKKILSLVFTMMLAHALLAQAPQLINFQGVARNAAGNVIAGKAITVRITLHEGGSTGNSVYSETRTVNTNAFGLFNIVIGSNGATAVTGSMPAVNWAAGNKFLQLEVDPAGGNVFTNIGTTQLVSVPYALNAGTATPSGVAGGDLTGSYPGPSITANAVTTSKVADKNITTPKIADSAVTDAKLAHGISYSKLTGAPTSLPPTGIAGGDLNGIYPNPKVANNAITTQKILDANVTTAKIADTAVTDNKLAHGISYSKLTGAPSSLPPTGTAGGDLNGTYPNPTVANNAITTGKILDANVTTAKISDNAVTTTKIADTAVTDSKLAYGISYSKLTGVPASLPPTGTAGGDLNGTYPNPTVANDAITTGKILDANVTTAKIADNAVTNVKIADTAVTDSKLAYGISYSKLSGAPASLPPTGVAGGDLNGTYPNPVVANDAITTGKILDANVTSAKIGDNAITTAKIADTAVTNSKLAYGISYSKLSGAPASLPPTGTAGGDLNGTYPNPIVANDAITTGKILDANITTAKIADNAVTTVKITDVSITTAKIADTAVTDSKLAYGISYSKLSGAPASLPPTGVAGGDLNGTYPNPTVANDAITTGKILDANVTTAKIADTAVTDSKLAYGISYSKLSGAPASLPPTGIAGGDLNGTYPNPVVANDAITTGKILDANVTTAKIADTAVTDSKLAYGISYSKLTGAPASLPPTGTAGGDLNGTYPNPIVANDAITTGKILDANVTTAKIADTAVTDSKLAYGISYSKLTGVPSSLPPTGIAGGDLNGTYPNPTVANDAITTGKILDANVTTAKIADNAITTTKITDTAVTDSKLAYGISYSKLSGAPASLPPTGIAGGDLNGTYPNPVVANDAITTGKILDANVTTAKIADTAVTNSKLAYGISYSKLTGAPASLPPTGTAGGDLNGTYPNPIVANDAITTGKILDANVTTAKIADTAVTDSKLAYGISYSKLTGVPSSLPPTGIAGGDLNGTYPNPTVANDAITTGKILDANVTTAKIADNAITTTKITDTAVTDSKLAYGISYSKLSGAPASLPPTGIAGGDLNGTYPNPTVANDAITTGKILDANVTSAKIADNAVTTVKITDVSITTSKIADTAVTDSKLAYGISYSKLSGAPASLPPTGIAGGDLNGTYPNPTVANDAITTGKILDANVTTAKIADTAVTDSKLAYGISYSKLNGAPASLPPTGTAGGDLNGTYPNPTVANDAITTGKILDANVTTAKIADNAVTTVKIADTAVTDSKLAYGISYSKLSGAPASLPPTGVAGGDLNGTYPNPTVANDAITTGKILDANVTTAKIADNAITTTKITDTAVTDSKLAYGISYNKLTGAPASLPPSGIAGGDLIGTYPNPVVANNTISSAKILDGTISSADIASNAAIPYSKLTLTNSVQNFDLVANSVTTSKVANGTVTTSKMADSAISGLKLLTYAVQNRHISDGAITTSKLSGTGANSGDVLSYNGTNVVWTAATTGATGAAGGDLGGTYPNPTVANDAITSAKILDGTISNADIAAGAAIPYSKLTLINSVQNFDLVANSVTTSKVANGTVTTSKMADSAISGLKLLTYAVQNRHISDGAVTTSKLSGTGANSGDVLSFNGSNVVWTAATTGATGAAGGDLGGTYPNPTVANDAITSAKILDGTISNADIAAGAAIPYSKLTLTNSVQNFDLVANSVTTSKVANGTVTTSKMADSAISGLKLLTYAVQNRHISDGAVTASKISAPGANSGDVLSFNGSNVVWTAATTGATGAAGGDLGGTYPNPTVANDAITSAKILDGTISNADIAAGAAIPYSKLTLTNSVQNFDLVANSVTTSKVANGTVTTSKMADSAISGLKLLTYAVQNRHISDGAVTASKISAPGANSGDVLSFNGSNVVWTAATTGATGAAGGDLGGTYPNPTVANDAITSAKILDGTISNADIAAGAAIPYSKLTLINSVQNFDLVANSVTTSKVANGTVTTSKMADSAISGLKLLTYAVQNRHISDGAVTASKISAPGANSGDVLSYNGTDVVWTAPTVGGGSPTGAAGGDLSGTYPNPTVANNAITSSKIADGTITNADIIVAAGIPYSKLTLTNSIQNGDITVNAITTSKVANGTVTTSKMADSAISGLKLLTYAVQSRHISDGAVTVPKISATGSANSGTFLRGDGAWAAPNAPAGMVVYSGVAGGAFTQTITDVNVRTVLVSYNGSLVTSSSINLTIPSAASYPAGTIINFSVTAHIGTNAIWNIVSASSNYSGPNFNASSMASGVTLGSASGFRLISDGSSNWYRIMP